MKVIRSGEVAEEDVSGGELFLGGKVTRQRLVGGDSSRYYTFNMIGFAAGARNKFHAHSTDQILFVTKGTGIIATEAEEVVIEEGDTILIPAGEKHWHGATADSDFAHISLTTPDTQAEIFG